MCVFPVRLQRLYNDSDDMCFDLQKNETNCSQ